MAGKRSSRVSKTSSRTSRKTGSRRRPLNIAIVGCGGMGRYHAGKLASLKEVRVTALCDVVKSRTQDYIKEFFSAQTPRPKTYTDYARMLRAEKLDGVVLVTPHTLHYTQARAALEKGIHVLCEKPMVTDAEQARALICLSEESGCQLGIAFQAPASREYAYIRNLLQRGDLGEIQMVQAHVAQNWLELSKGTWRQDPELSGGGELYDSGAHMLNAMMWLVDNPVERVFAMMDYRGAKVDINATVSIRFANGVLGSIACMGDSCLPTESGISLYGTKGAIKTSIWGGMLEHYNAKRERVKYPYMPYPDSHVDENFVQAILGHDELRCPPRYGLLLAELMDAVYESVETGQPVTVQHRGRPARRKK